MLGKKLGAVLIGWNKSSKTPKVCYNSPNESNEAQVSPTIFRLGSYRFFFNSREETRRHVHIATPDGIAKFWLEPTIALASYHNLSAKELRSIDELVREHEHDFKSAWDQHFSQSSHEH